MNKENTEKLFNDFPVLYRGRNKSLSSSLMSYGFACEDGWFQLIYDLSKRISEICLRVKAVQVKEKFGTLRFYVDGVQKNKQDQIYGLIEEFQLQSGITCERCGIDKTTNCEISEGSHLVKVLCAECRRKDEGQIRRKRE